MISIIAFIGIFAILLGISVAIFCNQNKYSRVVMSWMVVAIFLRIGLTLYYWNFTLHAPADAAMYFNRALTSPFDFKGFITPGTEFIKNLTNLIMPLTLLFPDRYLMTFIPFALLGFIGTMLFYKVLDIKTGLSIKEKIFIAFFLPNLIFWTSNLGKDSLIFFGLMMVFVGIYEKSNAVRIFNISLGGFVVYMIRPHTVLFLIISFGIAFLIERNKDKSQTMLIGVIAIVAFVLLYDRIFKFLGIRLSAEGEFGERANAVYNFATKRMESQASSLRELGGATTTVAKFKFIFFPVYVLNFLCAPFFWQVRKVLHAIGAFESLIYQYMIAYIFINYKYFIRTRLLQFKNAWIIYIITTSTILGATYVNFGLTTRQRCMVIPFVVMFYAITKSEKTKEMLLRKKKNFERLAIVPTSFPEHAPLDR